MVDGIQSFSTVDKSGVWDAVFEEVSKDQDTESWLIDATIVRAHQDASGAKKGGPKPSDEAEADPPQRYTLLLTP